MSAHALAAARTFAVVTTKATATEVVFGTYPSRAEAELVVSKLAAVGCTARCERARATDCPGAERRGQSAASAPPQTVRA